MSKVLQDRIALVTGASRGIGRAIARRFAQEGAVVVCIARTQGGLEDLDDEITAFGGKAILVPEDITRPGSIETIAKAVADRFGKLDVLVGNAGTLGGELSTVGNGGAQYLDRIFTLNVTSNWRLINAMSPLLLQSDGGRAIFVTDPVAHQNRPFWGGYSASKAALESMALTWAAEIGSITKIKVNLVAPCPVATRLRRQAFPGEPETALRQPDQITDKFVELAALNCTTHGQIVRID